MDGEADAEVREGGSEFRSGIFKAVVGLSTQVEREASRRQVGGSSVCNPPGRAGSRRNYDVDWSGD